ncbi:hypothetical protein [Acinetobacter venetianus]|uniref:hypothetical protein n=1 Tax=Acinetobacter venetianus TaxID=52133 RepID=UPI0021505D64|nr:hypothetical protein [Acinetobacter venetianus]MCR4532729.1 hypothetical protein [Acinetobacter venetianus]
MRSEWEKLFTAQRSYRSNDKEAFIRGCEAAYQHQQSKVDELTEQRDSFIKAYEIEMDKSVELQKRVDELKVGCGLQRDHIKGLEAELKKAWTTVDQAGHKNHDLVMLLNFIKEHFEMNDLDKAMPRVYEKLEQALKGGGDANQ